MITILHKFLHRELIFCFFFVHMIRTMTRTDDGNFNDIYMQRITHTCDVNDTSNFLATFIFKEQPTAREKPKSTSRHPATHLRDNQGTSAGALLRSATNSRKCIFVHSTRIYIHYWLLQSHDLQQKESYSDQSRCSFFL